MFEAKFLFLDDCSTFLRKSGWDFSYNDIESSITPKPSYLSCCLYCSGISNCQAFTWNKLDRRCIPKTSVGDGGSADRDGESGYKQIRSTTNENLTNRLGKFKH